MKEICTSFFLQKTIVKHGFNRIDKTAAVWRFANDERVFFLSRSRRFGKTFQLSTFNEQKDKRSQAAICMHNAGKFRGLQNNGKITDETTCDMIAWKAAD